MTVPGFQSLMLPLLKLASDGHEYRLRTHAANEWAFC